MRALFVANLDSFHNSFHIPYIKRLKDKGYDIDLVSTGSMDFSSLATKYDIIFGRTPTKFQNFKAFKQLRNLVKKQYYDIIYFSTPVVGAVGRMALIGVKHGRVIYSAHGYSFYNGNTYLSNWKYIFVERWLCKLTDCVFTMNQEDYDATQKYNFPVQELYNVDGVGVDTSLYQKPTLDEKNGLRKKYGYRTDDFIMIYPAEYTERKNQTLLFDALQILVRQNKNIRLLLPGRGILEDKYKNYVSQHHLDDYVEFLGFRRDVKDLLKASDILFASSLNEGLPINVIEALATGLPVVATKVRGHVDLIEEGYNGYLFDKDDRKKCYVDICNLINKKELYDIISTNALASSKKYDLVNVVPQFDKIWGV